jgi:YD repeat-containing protein
VNTYTQRYAYIKNSGGTLVAAASPIWVKSTETECQTVTGSSPAAVCDGAAPQKTTTYEYGATGTGQSLLVKGMVVTADSTSLRTCYGYDQWGNKISETTPRAGLASCP